MNILDTPTTILLELKKKLWIIQLNNELEDISQSLFGDILNNNDSNYITNRIDSINYILNILNKDDKINNIKKESNLDKVYEVLDIKAYSMCWNKLHINHKIHKIKEFVLEKYNNNNDLEKILLEAINNGQLNLSKYVIYDKDQMKITDMPFIKQINNGEFIIRINS
jgi:hypothetical protein